MANYFELIGDNDNVVIDDNTHCLEIIDSFPLSQCTKKTEGVRDIVYQYPRVVNALLYGISVNDLSGKSWFSFVAGSDKIRFYGSNSSTNTGMVSIARDDIVESATLYAFGIKNSNPTSSGVGLEICNADGKVVYSSMRNYLNAMACGSDTAMTVSLEPNTIAINLGYDRACDYYQSHTHGLSGADYTLMAAFSVTDTELQISRVRYGTAYIDWTNADLDDFETLDHYYESWLGFGWLVGKV